MSDTESARTVTDTIRLVRATHPWTAVVLTVLWQVAGIVVLLETWGDALHPHALGGIVMIVTGTLIGKSPVEIGAPKGVERRRSG